MDAFPESIDNLIAKAEAAGFQVSRQDIRRSQRAGLIPAPQQRARGRGRGTVVRYPAGTADQFVLVLRVREGRRRPLQLLRWLTWWNGGRIDERWIRAELLEAAARGFRDRQAMLAAADTSEAGDEAWRQLERRSGKALRALPVKIRGNFRTLASPTLLTLTLQLLEGIPPDPVGMSELLGGMEFEPILPADEELLATVSSAFRRADLGGMATAIPLPVLQQLRDEMRVIYAMLPGIESSIEGLAPQQARVVKHLFAAAKTVIATSDVLLLWMVLRSTRQAGDLLLAWLRKTAVKQGLLGTGA